MVLSTHKVEVVPVRLEPHPNADSLSIVTVFGYTCCVRTADWAEKQIGAYLPPDSVVDVTRPEFAFLASGTKTKHRVRVVKLRGVQSYGLLMPAPDGSSIGDDVAEFYGIEHYEPELRACCTGGEAEAAPQRLGCLSRYDVDALRRYQYVFEPGEEVMVTEKIHGANSRYCYLDGRMWCGSRSEWKREDDNNLWWKALRSAAGLADFCRTNPGVVVYGEVFGDVQSFRYGCKKGEARFAAFDVLDPNGTFRDARDLREEMHAAHVPQVPLVEFMPYSFDAICADAEGPSLVPGAEHVREGCVVKPIHERWHADVGRVQLKVAGTGYLEKDQ